MSSALDVIIIGAGASGLMCAIEAGKRGLSIIVVDHKSNPAKKLLLSGGGKCNFTNYNIDAENYISENPHFCKSALSQFTQWDFLELLRIYNIEFEEREHGQLFCKNKASDIYQMLLTECEKYEVEFKLNETNLLTAKDKKLFKVEINGQVIFGKSLVIATGGLSLPETGATSFGYKVAEQFGLNIIPPRPGLVPFTYCPKDKEKFLTLSGIAILAMVENAKKSFTESLLFTHRGLSGPVILQLSLYWSLGESIIINLLPNIDLFTELKQEQKKQNNKILKTILSKYLPKRLIAVFLSEFEIEKPLQQISHKQLQQVAKIFNHWNFTPNNTEGYRTAEVTIGGVDCDEISSKTMEAKKQKNLFFTGEVLDITGWLGGYNLQWAWSSGWTAGQYV